GRKSRRRPKPPGRARRSAAWREDGRARGSVVGLARAWARRLACSRAEPMFGWSQVPQSKWSFSGTSRWTGSDCRGRESEFGCPRKGHLVLRGIERRGRPSLPSLSFYFRLKSALTWAVTVTVWGENASVGAGAASVFMAMTRGTTPTGRTVSKVSTDA